MKRLREAIAPYRIYRLSSGAAGGRRLNELLGRWPRFADDYLWIHMG